MRKNDEIIRKEVEEARLMQASMCNGWERQQWFIDFNQEKKPHSDQQLRQFILNYFRDSYVSPFDLEGYCCQRFTPNPEAVGLQMQPKVIILYGADYMPSKKVLKYFSYFEPLNITWLDDSSCSIEFANADTAKKAIYENAEHFDKKQQYERILRQGFEDLPIQDQLQWFSLAPYYEMAFERKLFARIGTNAEIVGFDPKNALTEKYGTRRHEFFDLYAKSKYEEVRERLWKERSTKWGVSEHNNHDGGRNNRERRGYQHRDRDRPSSYRRDDSRRNSVYRREDSVDMSFQKNRCNESRCEMDMSKFNYSFQKHQHIKEEADNQPEEEDSSMLSFRERFENLNLSNSRQNMSFERQPKQPAEDKSDILDNSFLKEKSGRVKEQQQHNLSSLSFKKNEVIEIDDEDD